MPWYLELLLHLLFFLLCLCLAQKIERRWNSCSTVFLAVALSATAATLLSYFARTLDLLR